VYLFRDSLAGTADERNRKDKETKLMGFFVFLERVIKEALSKLQF
jgi:hypothetical protein